MYLSLSLGSVNSFSAFYPYFVSELIAFLSFDLHRDFMEGTMEKTNKMLAFLHPIIEKADPELEDFLIRYMN